jgi:hypothetical protein
MAGSSPTPSFERLVAQHNFCPKASMSMSEKNAPLFKADSVMLGLSAQKSEDSPIKADRLRVTYAGSDPLRLARMAT